MNFRSYLHLMLAAAAFSLIHLGYEFSSGGVQSHHLLNRADLPAISNAWGLLVLPLLAWILGLRLAALAKSSGPAPDQVSGSLGMPRSVLVGLLVACGYGAAFSVSFAFDQETLLSSLFLGLFVAALLLPVYRAECVLGFVVGMSFTFGAVLPTLISGVVALISVIFYPLLRMLFRFLVSIASRSRVTKTA